MDKIEKALQKLSTKERYRIKQILLEIAKGQTRHLDMRKLKERDDIFRVWSSNLRIIFRRDKLGDIFILTIARRNEKTYRFK